VGGLLALVWGNLLFSFGIGVVFGVMLGVSNTFTTSLVIVSCNKTVSLVLSIFGKADEVSNGTTGTSVVTTGTSCCTVGSTTSLKPDPTVPTPFARIDCKF
jgi:hypothetical protein